MIREGLAGKRVLLTGVTGFLGTAIFERLIADTPVGKVDLVIRGDAAARLKWMLAGSAFEQSRRDLDPPLAERVEQKVNLITADLANQTPEIPPDVDLVIHAAATVSFDPPIDEAFATNLAGTTNLYQACAGKPFIHVSTAYVAGLTRGTQLEEPLSRDVDWRLEAESARRLAMEVEADSRRPEVLERLQSRAQSEMGKAGPQSAARRAEELRRKWVKDRLVTAGKARARTLGWPDVYTFTKGLTEIALYELAGENPLTIVRPSIIESALERPFPGWIEGFRMADPVMLAFGRGLFPEFPGIPDGVLDLIPVDMVVNCLLAIAAQPPRQRAIYHVCSGNRNPLRLRRVYDNTREYFLTNPLPERDRGTYRVPEWSFPGRRTVDRRLRTAGKMIETAERVVGRIPRGRFARDASRRVDRLRRRYDFVKRYADLYGPYVEIEAIYTDDLSRALFETLPDEDQRDFNFDPASFTWHHYLQEVHLPMLTTPLRWPEPTKPDPSVSISPNGAGSPAVVAAFDVEGTVVASNVLEAFMWLRLSEITDPVERALLTGAMAIRAPSFVKAERRDRGEFLRMFYRQYKGVSSDAVRRLAGKSIAGLILSKLAPPAVRRIREHRRAGHTIIFITGSLDFIVEPLQPLTDEIVSARLDEVDGIFSGDLATPPLVGEARASWLRDYAASERADLSRSYAYADSMSDLPMLEAVGNPVAVNPDVPLARVARERGWPVEEWRPEKGKPRVLVPEVVR